MKPLSSDAKRCLDLTSDLLNDESKRNARLESELEILWWKLTVEERSFIDGYVAGFRAHCDKLSTRLRALTKNNKVDASSSPKNEILREYGL